MSTIKIKQVKSSIGKTKRQIANLKALGLRKIGHVVEHNDNESLRGMLNKVSHLVKIIK